MDKIFHIRVLNSPNGDFREVELDLPARDYELLDATEQLWQEDGKRPYLESHAAEEYVAYPKQSSPPIRQETGIPLL